MHRLTGGDLRIAERLAKDTCGIITIHQYSMQCSRLCSFTERLMLNIPLRTDLHEVSKIAHVSRQSPQRDILCKNSTQEQS